MAKKVAMKTAASGMPKKKPAIVATAKAKLLGKAAKLMKKGK